VKTKPNPCPLCGRQPWGPEKWGDGKGKRAVFCYHGLATHSLATYGKTDEKAVERWNKLGVKS
jgi:hypothetical protein